MLLPPGRRPAWLRRWSRCATEAAATGRACFVVPASTREAGAGREPRSVTETAVIVVDLDDGDIAAKRAHLVEHLGAPTLVVASGGVTAAGAAEAAPLLAAR